MSFLVSRRDQNERLPLQGGFHRRRCENREFPDGPLGQIQSRPVCSEFASGEPVTRNISPVYACKASRVQPDAGTANSLCRIACGSLLYRFGDTTQNAAARKHYRCNCAKKRYCVGVLQRSLNFKAML